MKLDTGQWVSIARTLLIAALTIASILGYDIAIIQPREIVVQEETLSIARMLDTDNAMPLAAAGSHFTGLEANTIKAAAPTAVGTATPALVADSLGVSNLFEARANATPVAYIDTSGNMDWEGYGNVASSLTIGSLFLPSHGNFAPTAGQILTPTLTFYSVDSSGAVSMTLGASCTQGQPLILYGDDANTVTVNDTNIFTTDGNAVTFGQYDAVLWVCDTNTWIHVAKSANS